MKESSPDRAQAHAARHARAVVVGGSMVGMAVAQALSETFREVIVVEKDALPRTEVAHRRGVQQSWHVHNLTLRGKHELEELFPGFEAEAMRLGAAQVDFGRDSARCTFEGFCPLFETGVFALSATRALLELAERRRFLELCKNARFLENTRVLSLLLEDEADGSGKRAVGVTTDNPDHEVVRAELVVDCSGRSTQWKGWFKEHGLPLPRETVVDSQCGYASRFYERPGGNPYEFTAMSVDPIFPKAPRWAVVVPIENDQWVVTIGGFNGNYPPSDEQGFERFGEGLQTPLFSEWLSGAKPVSPVRTFRKLEKRWHHFEDYQVPLAGFLAVGDAAWAYNPQYGQGMSIGVTCARILRDTLRTDSDLQSLPARYYPAAKEFAFPPWKTTSLLDLAWPSTEGQRPWYTEPHRRVGQFFLRACQYENEVFVSFLDAVHLLKGPLAIVLKLRVMRGLLRFGFRALTATLPAQSFAAPTLLSSTRADPDDPGPPSRHVSPPAGA